MKAKTTNMFAFTCEDMPIFSGVHLTDVVIVPIPDEEGDMNKFALEVRKYTTIVDNDNIPGETGYRVALRGDHFFEYTDRFFATRKQAEDYAESLRQQHPTVCE